MTQREAFEEFAARGYGAKKTKILALLDGCTEQEAIALLDIVRAEISLRDAWIVKSNPVCKAARQTPIRIEGNGRKTAEALVKHYGEFGR